MAAPVHARVGGQLQQTSPRSAQHATPQRVREVIFGCFRQGDQQARLSRRRLHFDRIVDRVPSVSFDRGGCLVQGVQVAMEIQFDEFVQRFGDDVIEVFRQLIATRFGQRFAKRFRGPWESVGNRRGEQGPRQSIHRPPLGNDRTQGLVRKIDRPRRPTFLGQFVDHGDAGFNRAKHRRAQQRRVVIERIGFFAFLAGFAKRGDKGALQLVRS